MRVQRAKEIVEQGAANPREIPSYLLRKSVGLEPAKFGSHAIPNAVAKSLYRRRAVTGRETVVWDEDWDLLVVLDSCRPEWLATAADEVDWLAGVETRCSVGSHSREWIMNTFSERYRDEIEDTVYVTGNPYSHEAPRDRFVRFEDVTEVEWSLPSPVPPAHLVTDRAVTVAREAEWERCIVHYMQPHKPIFEPTESRREPALDERWQPSTRFWRKYIDGHVSKAELESAFRQNLRYVLEEVDLLLRNVDAPTAVLTSDHGQALGERYLWSHRHGVKHPSMRRVPWTACRATDDETLDPDEHERTTETDQDRRERLRQLGYL